MVIERREEILEMIERAKEAQGISFTDAELENLLEVISIAMEKGRLKNIEKHGKLKKEMKGEPYIRFMKSNK